MQHAVPAFAWPTSSASQRLWPSRPARQMPADGTRSESGEWCDVMPRYACTS
eukprot:CAMPEP_0177400006 /NCGR_PEP_ID=MMETSP0368-20130122/58821_1 /TAXON_ID=447022 ORGANISM="Scrippsiella hangoei-like, Strain SHHI-4" /NCGR_SAMPLE_ID=MMETSP0368 /ASSEMBLY_ACC=CAM_ASM_000363 /LENGTH=51 /DNA_ID=CAMNT_0018867361 /DNA_START=352 /DNA_END=504 /DNA_ORIENTATION=+